LALRSQGRATTQSPSNKNAAEESYCGGEHLPSTYRFTEVMCNECHKKGNLARVCRTNSQSQAMGETANGPSQQSQNHQQQQARTNKEANEKELDEPPLL